MRIRKTYKGDGTEQVISLEEALHQLRDNWNMTEEEIIETLKDGMTLWTCFAYYEGEVS